MTPVIWTNYLHAPDGHKAIGVFFDDAGKPTPMYFFADDEMVLRRKMVDWLKAERDKQGITEENIARRREALAKARATRQAKKVAAE